MTEYALPHPDQTIVFEDGDTMNYGEMRPLTDEERSERDRLWKLSLSLPNDLSQGIGSRMFGSGWDD